MKTLTLASLAAVALCATSSASNFSVSGAGGAIPDFVAGTGTWNVSYTGVPFTSTVAVANPVTSITAVKLQGLTHTWRGDLHIFLKDPAGVVFNVVTRPGSTGASVGDSGNYNVGNYDFVDAGGGTILQGATNINPGAYNVYQNTGTGIWTLGGANNAPLASITGPAGTWTLEIRDWAGLDVGTLTGWTLEGTDGASPITPFCFGDGLDLAHTTPCPCANTGAAGNGCANSSVAAGANLATTGTVLADDVVLHGSAMPATVACIYLQGDALEDALFGDGVRCTGGTLIRMRTKINVGGASSFPESGVDTITLSARGGVTVGSGAQRFYQTYYRNSAALFCPPETFNVTNGIQILW